MIVHKPAHLMPINQKISLIVDWFYENHKIEKWGAHQSHWAFVVNSVEESGMVSSTLFKRTADGLNDSEKNGCGQVIITQYIKTGEIRIGWYSLPGEDQRMPGQTYSTLAWSSLDEEKKFENKVETSKPEGYGTWA